ncbi:CpaD family pilus assembly protein [Sphingobium boeckii]|uniref:Pilus assembly protein CpaD n=1 Tax=Sphingobium boeckii TaxID=1082345 RepID=A0A7W9EFB5_9SPHN|nr:CpaD family pilus assembly protein [Sphingobium boeckii]MBB5687062.1 pilus assembly protein CpaD [Sphingobium boeckii]
MQNILLRNAAAPAMLALSLALGGCGAGTYNPTVESVHQPVVSRVDYALDLRQGGNGGLASGEQQRLNDWFESLRLGYGDQVSVDDRNPYGNAASREDVASAAARYGLLTSETAPVTAGTVGDGMVRVVVSRMSASVPGCPDWSRPAQPEFGGSSMSNYGCATNANLAAMIANPVDLIQGQTGNSGTDGRASSKAIKAFRDKAPTGAGAIEAVSSKGQ